MNSKRCPSCGFFNLAFADACRKCGTSLHSVGTFQPAGQQASANPYAYGYGYQQPSQRKGSTSAWIKFGAAVGALIVVAFAAAVVWGVLFVKSHSKLAWEEFRPGEPGLSVMMPCPPVAHDPIVTPIGSGEIKNYGYSSTVIGQGTATFSIVVFPVSFTHVNVQPEKLQKMLEAEMDNLLKGTSATLVSKSPFDEGEVKGLSFEFKPQGRLVPEDERGYGKMYVTANRLYVLTIVSREKSELNQGREKFLAPTIPFL